MAATDARPVPRKNVAYRYYFAIRKPSDSTLITTWTGMDSEVSLDGAGFNDCASEATEVGTTGCGFLDLSAAEMNADEVTLKITVTNTGAVPLVFTLYPEESGDYRADATLINGDATAAANLAKSAAAIVTCTATTGGTTTSVPTSACSPAGSAADHFKGRIIIFLRDTTTAALRGQATDITASSASATPTFTVTALTTAPVSGETFVIV